MAWRLRGFTLIELMVVILIIGVMATFVTLSIGNRALDDRMENESHRIEELTRLGLEEADLKGIPIGLSFGPGGYGFLAINDKKLWSPYTGSEILRPRRLSEPFFVQLMVENHAVAPLAADTPPEKVVPQILLLPGGDVTAFALDLRAPNDRLYYHIESDSQGHIKRERRQDQ